MPNRFLPLGQNSSLEESIRVVNGNFAQLDNEAVTKTFTGPGGQPAFILGQLPNNLGEGLLLKDTSGKTRIAAYIDSSDTPVLKVAKAGKDAVTGSDADMIFNSAQDIFKIVSTGSTTIPAVTIANPGAGNYGSNNSTVNVAHGLSSIPAVVAYLEIYNSGAGKNNYYQLPYSSPSGGGAAAVFYNAYFYADDTNVTFGQGALCHGVGTTLGAVNVKYFILQETAV